MDNLKEIFNETLEREGKDIIVSDTSIKVFFRKK